MSDGLNYPDYLYGDALAKKPITSPDFTEVHIIKAMEQTASASEHLVAALKLVRAKRNFEAMAADAQARGEYDEKAARDLVWSAERSPPRPPDEVYHLYPESIRQRNHALPPLLAESLHDIAKRDYPQPNDWHVSAGIPVESAYLASFGPNETVGEKLDRVIGAPIKEHRRVLTEAERIAFGIGDLPTCWRASWVTPSRHPMQAEADRIIGTELHPLSGPESRL
jgi:DNA-binding phage protein